MIRILRERKKAQLKNGTKETSNLEISGFRVKDNVKIQIRPSLFRKESENITIETWKD